MGRATADPADRVTLDESVNTAFLVVLESMTPAERVTAIADGGGLVTAQLQPVEGGEQVARILVDIADLAPDLTLLERDPEKLRPWTTR